MAHQRWLGASDPSEVLGRTVFDFFPDEIARACSPMTKRIISSGQPLINHEELLSRCRGQIALGADDESAVAATKTAPIHGLVCISRDITEQKAAEASLHAG